MKKLVLIPVVGQLNQLLDRNYQMYRKEPVVGQLNQLLDQNYQMYRKRPTRLGTRAIFGKKKK